MKKLFPLLLLIVGCYSDECLEADMLTLCNPLDIEYRLSTDGDMPRRDIGSPCVVLFQNVYYLFATNAEGYYRSSDLVRWDAVSTNLPSDAIAPTVMEMDGELYFMASFKTDTIYKTKHPEKGVWEIATDSFPYVGLSQPMLFRDGNKVYFYASIGNPAVLAGVEINPLTLCPSDTLKPLVKGDRLRNGWEKPGDYNDWEVSGPTWMEDGWMIKHQGRYYLQYASPGSYLKSSNDALYVSDTPLGPFTLAAHNPFACKPEGFVSGIGYGSIFADKHGNYWHIGTVPLATKGLFEGRLALHPVFFDKDGIAYAYTGWGDYPMYIPARKTGKSETCLSGWMLLSYNKPVQTSSGLRKYPGECANDENVRSFWSAQSASKGEYLCIDVGKGCQVCAVQVSFADYELDSSQPVDNCCYQFLIEASSDGRHWELVADFSDNRHETTHCYIPFARPVEERYFRIVNIRCPTGKFALLEFRVFGRVDKPSPGRTAIYTADRSLTDRRTVVLKWKPASDAVGYNIRYGNAPDKLYHNHILYGDTELTIRSLQADRPYYFTVDSFNEGGITDGKDITMIN